MRQTRRTPLAALGLILVGGIAGATPPVLRPCTVKSPTWCIYPGVERLELHDSVLDRRWTFQVSEWSVESRHGPRYVEPAVTIIETKDCDTAVIGDPALAFDKRIQIEGKPFRSVQWHFDDKADCSLTINIPYGEEKYAYTLYGLGETMRVAGIKLDKLLMVAPNTGAR